MKASLNRSTSRLIALSIGLSFVASAQAAPVPDVLGLEAFLGQVKKGNTGYTGAVDASDGAASRASEGERVYAPSLFAKSQWTNDQSPKMAPTTQGTTTINNVYSLGISKLWNFGLTSSLKYELGFTSIQGALIPTPTYHDARPILELSLPVWGGGFGRTARAQSEAVKAGAFAVSQAEAYQAQQTIAVAESAYWRLAVARDVSKVQRENLDRAKRTVDWSSRRVRLNLADASDLYQAQAAYKVRELELQVALDELRGASLAFNSMRGVVGDQVLETIENFEDMIERDTSVPVRHGRRRDVEAAYQQSIATQAGAKAAVERNRPTLDVYSSLALNGRDVPAGGAISNSFETDQPATTVGLRLTIPLDLGTQGSVRDGYQREIEAAGAKFARKAFEEEAEWDDLSKRFQESVHRFRLASELEQVQRKKYEHERERQSRGKTTAFFVLQFEQDYASSQVERLRRQSEILDLVARMRVFEGGV